MKTISKDELKRRVEQHELWVRNNENGERLILVGYDLRRSDLRNSDLSFSDLRNSDLSFSDLSNSDLSFSNLSNSGLSSSDLSYSNLRGSDLSCSALWGTDLSNSNLIGAELSNVKYNECTSFFALVPPEEGSFIGFKKNKWCYCKITDTRRCKTEFSDN